MKRFGVGGFFAVAVVMAVGVVSAQGDNSAPVNAQRFVAEEVAAVVGNMTIMLSDIEAEAVGIEARRKEQGTLSRRSAREEAFENLLHQKLMASAAKADSLDKDMRPVDGRVEEIVGKMVTEAGSITALERKMGKPIFQIRSEMVDDVTEMQLSQMMEYKVRDRVKVNNDDVVKFYNNLPVDSMPPMPVQYVYAQIVKFPPTTQARKFEMREQLLEYRRRILAGERFSVLATLYSADRGSAIKGGEIGPQPLGSFMKPFAEALQNLKPGQISEVVETEVGFHIIELISLKDGNAHFRHILLTPDFSVEDMYKAANSLDSVARQIREGKVTFADAVITESQDKDTKMNSGVVFNTNGFYQTQDLRNASTRFLMDELDAQDYRVISKLKVGEVSSSYEAMNNANRVYKIVKLIDIVPAHKVSLDYDYEMIESAALEDKKNRELNRWVDGAIERTYIYIAPEYRNLQFERAGWVKPYKSLLEVVDTVDTVDIVDVVDVVK